MQFLPLDRTEQVGTVTTAAGRGNFPVCSGLCSGSQKAGGLKNNILKERYPNVCLVHLYALEGGGRNVEFNSFPERRKRNGGSLVSITSRLPRISSTI